MVITVTLNPTIDKTLSVRGFHVGDHARARVVAVVPAGKGINVARGLRCLSCPAVACGFVGRNEEGLYTAELARQGIETRFCAVEGTTRANTTVLDPVRHTTTHLREEGFLVAASELAAMRQMLPEAVASHSSGGVAPAVAFCGSLPRGVTPSDFVGLLTACAQAGADVIVDTNGEALREAVHSDIVHTIAPNLLELGHCLGHKVRRSDAPALAGELLSHVQTVLLTLGEEGGYAIDGRATLGVRCPVPPEKVRSALGCGDAFLAGWLCSRQIGGGPAEALRWAVAAGAACAQTDTVAGYTASMVESERERCTAM